MFLEPSLIPLMHVMGLFCPSPFVYAINADSSVRSVLGFSRDPRQDGAVLDPAQEFLQLG